MLLLLWTLSACVQWEGGDADEDGVSPGQGDCNDLDPDIGPGQTEIWYDGIDQNCDGNDADQDGDGFLSTLAGGDDCWDDPTLIPDDFTIVAGQGFVQPSAADVFPGSDDTWYDGVDANCDGLGDFDQDGDGYDSAAAVQRDGSAGDDCVDSQEDLDALGAEEPVGVTPADIHPGADPASDACYDGVNLDCDLREPAPDNPTASWDSDFDCDQDGWMADQDCDDDDATAVPDLSIDEVWYDCVDQNCDSNDGDQDGDGWIPEYYTQDCPDWLDLHGGDQATVQVGDCWDGGEVIPSDFQALNGFPQLDALDVYPGAADTWYDGVDADCAGDSDFDADGDSQDTDSYDDRDGLSGTDCDDSEPTIYEGATEYCDDVDRDCDGLIADDDDAVDGIQYYYDEDDDGYGTSVSRTSCEPTGFYRADNPDDCDDTDAATHPGADEYCDTVDRDCDSAIDEDHALDASTWYTDGDGDGFGDPSTADVECYQPTGTVSDDTDCDDTDATVKPGATEICDGQLNDCDGGSLPTDESDDDGDGYVECTWVATGWDGSGAVVGGDDCDDTDALSFPGGTETCDGVADEDCDTQVDEDGAVDVVTWYLDGDSDGHGDATISDLDCAQPTGHVADDTDCNDADATVHPGATELCDGILNDCDGSGLPSDETDDDGDGAVECTFDAGGWDGTNDVLDDQDCDDADPLSFPGGTETCDGVADEDCDGSVDEAGASDASTWYRDSDVDSYGDSTDTKIACSLPAGYVADDTDCDDGDASVNPGGTELCDGSTDEDCDTTVDEDGASDVLTWYHDADADGFGDAADSDVDCDQPTDFVSNDTDCDDDDDTVFPAATELCDGLQNDCDGSAVPSDETDDDGDGAVECTWDAGGWDGSAAVTSGDDCDDTDPLSFPGGTETCDGTADEDCDSTVDEDGASDADTWYLDGDSDTYGDSATTTTACELPAGYVADDTDCDDGDGGVNPGASELCDGLVDEDCDLSIDEATAIDASTWYLDQDGDGFGLSTDSVVACDAPTGYVADDTDCDDGDVSLYPAAPELCDGLINDCDSASLPSDETDDDGDFAVECTFDPNGWQGTNDVLDDQDCDDADPLSFPGGTETCDGSADEDCDGVVDEVGCVGTTADADVVYDGDAGGDRAGFLVDAGGDLTGDGIEDLVIGAYGSDRGNGDAGSVFLASGALTGTVDLGTMTSVVEGWSGSGRASYDLMGGGDADGDGQVDLVIGAYAADTDGQAYLVHGPITGITDLASPTATVESAGGNVRMGISVGFLWPQDGGAADAVIVGADRYDVSKDEGQVLVFDGPTGTLDETSALAIIVGDQQSEALGFAIDGTGDLDGDGVGDLLLGAERYDDGTTNKDAGAAYLFYGPVSGSLTVLGADETTIGTDGAKLGQALDVGSDVDGDGLDDVLLGGFEEASVALDGGVVYLFTGGLSGAADSTATATIAPTDSDQDLGWSVRLGGDVDGDGVGDILVGAPRADGTAGTQAGHAALFYGPISGTLTLDQANQGWEGQTKDSRAGTSVCFVPDLDGDGLDEVLIGADKEDAVEGDQGAAYLFYGGGI